MYKMKHRFSIGIDANWNILQIFNPPLSKKSYETLKFSRKNFIGITISYLPGTFQASLPCSEEEWSSKRLNIIQSSDTIPLVSCRSLLSDSVTQQCSYSALYLSMCQENINVFLTLVTGWIMSATLNNYTCTVEPLNADTTQIWTLAFVNCGNSVQNYPWIKDSYLGPNGVHSKGVPLYNTLGYSRQWNEFRLYEALPQFHENIDEDLDPITCRRMN